MTPASDQNARDTWDATFGAAREFIRRRYQEDGCVVGIGEVLEHVDEVFGAQAGLTGDVGIVLNLITALWEDPHVDQVPGDWIAFCWNEAGDWPRDDGHGLVARLRGRSDREEPR
jgi:hypothetical protein